MFIYFLYIFYIYAFIVFFLSRLMIPHLGFKKEILPEKIPKSMDIKIDEIKNESKNSIDFLTLSFIYLGKRYKTRRVSILFHLPSLFKGLDSVWQRAGYIPCTQGSYVMRIFLVRSGFFVDSDVRVKYTVLNFLIHQYLEVRIGKEWFDVDVGEFQRGIKLGSHKGIFG